ncbi:hypothetical protein SB861_52315 [Paraburkholderia sp. SIMBA_049]
MSELRPDEAVALARNATSAAASMMPHVWQVERSDRIGEAYYLIVFGDEQAPTAICAVAANGGTIMASAKLGGTNRHIKVDETDALKIANLDASDAKLVWQPCRASFSPLYPFWRVSNPSRTVFIDQQGNCWDGLPSGRG